MAIYNAFIPGAAPAPVVTPKQKINGKGQAATTTERPVPGTMFYGINAANPAAALGAVQAVIGANLSEAASIFLQSNDTRLDHP